MPHLTFIPWIVMCVSSNLDQSCQIDSSFDGRTRTSCQTHFLSLLIDLLNISVISLGQPHEKRVIAHRGSDRPFWSDHHHEDQTPNLYAESTTIASPATTTMKSLTTFSLMPVVYGVDSSPPLHQRDGSIPLDRTARRRESIEPSSAASTEE